MVYDSHMAFKVDNKNLTCFLPLKLNINPVFHCQSVYGWCLPTEI